MIADLRYGKPNSMSKFEEDTRQPTLIRNARGRGFTLDEHGFELVEDQRPRVIAATADADDAALISHWYPECCAIVRELTGATRCYVANHVKRSSAHRGGHELVLTDAMKRGEQARPKNQQLSGIDEVHADFTRDSAFIARIQQEGGLQQQHEEEGEKNPAASSRSRSSSGSRSRHVRVVNVWQSISDRGPVRVKPLALCDPASVNLRRDGRRRHCAANGNTVWNLARHDPAQRWWYYDAMARGELLVFFGYHPDQPVFHSAFESGAPPGGGAPPPPPRESLETRVVCVFDQDPDGDTTAPLPRYLRSAFSAQYDGALETFSQDVDRKQRQAIADRLADYSRVQSRL